MAPITKWCVRESFAEHCLRCTSPNSSYFLRISSYPSLIPPPATDDETGELFRLRRLDGQSPLGWRRWNERRHINVPDESRKAELFGKACKKGGRAWISRLHRPRSLKRVGTRRAIRLLKESPLGLQQAFTEMRSIALGAFQGNEHRTRGWVFSASPRPASEQAYVRHAPSVDRRSIRSRDVRSVTERPEHERN